MKSILELGLEFFISKKKLSKYDEIAQKDARIEDKIYELLTFNPSFMSQVENDQPSFLSQGEVITRNVIMKNVKSEKKIEFVTLYFNPKSAKKSITNNLVFPDASDFLTLLHLSLVFQKINNIYPPGASLFIGTEFNYFHKFATLDLRATSEMTSILMRFKMIIESMLKSSIQIHLFDVYEEISFFKKDFLSRVEKEKFNYLSNKSALDELKNTASYYYDFVIEQDNFPSKEAAKNFCIFHSLDAAGYTSAIRSLPDLKKGFFKDFNSKILINPRVFKNSHSQANQNEVYLPLLPGAFTFSFNMLTLRKKDNNWDQITYQDIRNQHYKEFFVRDLPYPFFFTETRFRGHF